MRATRSTWLNLQTLGEPTPELVRATRNLSPVVAQVLHNRGIDARQAPTFLAPEQARGHDPFLLLGMKAAVERLFKARRNQELVALYGDLDVDGIAAVAVLANACELVGIKAYPYFLNGTSRGCDLDGSTLRDLAARGARVVVTADCGISSVGAAPAAKDCGLDLIVTDHHLPPERLPDALAVIDPRQPGCPYPNKDLAGVGVAFKLARALLSAVGARAGCARTLLDLVAIGTIADMVPLIDENRLLVWQGMRVLNTTTRPGLQALIARGGLRMGSITSTDVSYRLCPRLNAAGQDDHGSLGYDILMTQDGEAADLLAHRLQEKHAARQSLAQQVLDTVHQQLAIDTGS
ncbi:MAG: single-stranded-DNA-specific exonuclease RecJ, partial [Chloroflexota bacterium]